MRWLSLNVSLPLLAKELIELANRRRTYVVRSVYAAALFGCGLLIVYGKGGVAVDSGTRLGEGREMFLELVGLQLAGIYLLLPAMCAASIAGEKERDTLTLLLLTTLSPTSILVQKYLGRVIPMLCFVVLSFPLLAVAYSYGGVTTQSLYAAMAVLLLAVLHVGAVALMCSAYCRTTVEAFMAAYVLLAVTLFCIPVGIPIDLLNPTRTVAAEILVSRLTIATLTTLACLAVARVCLVTRAFVPPRNLLLQFFQALDAMFQEMNQLTGGVVLVDDGQALPESKPVAWRETRKRSLGTFRYLFRVLVALELPILVVAQEVNLSAIQNRSAVSILLYILWVIGMALVCIHAASVISSERSRQTLDSLLTAPLRGRDILLQKMAGVRRLIYVLQVPFLTIFLFHHWLRDFHYDLTYFGLSLATSLVFLPGAAWLSLWLGLKLRSQLRAVLAALVAVGLIAYFPSLLKTLSRALGWRLPGWLSPVFDFGAASIIHQVENWGVLVSNAPSPAVATQRIVLILVMGLYAAAAWCVRWHCLRHADVLLGRIPEVPGYRAATEQPVPEPVPEAVLAERSR